MDDAEKRVLRRWKPVIAENIVVNAALIQALKQAALLTEDTMQQTIVGDNESTKTTRIVDLVIACPERGSFSAFRDVLATQQSWIARDLEADARIERGDVVIEDDILRETAMLVHRKFGTSKRLCETDKKGIRDLMAIKLQVVTDEWRLTAGGVKSRLEGERASAAGREVRCRQLVTLLCEFLRDHEQQLVTHAHGMITTSDTLRRSLVDVHRDTLSRLQAGIAEVLNQFKRVITQRDAFHHERVKCQQLLGVKDVHKPLDDVIEKMLTSKASEDGPLTRNSAETREAKRLASRLLDLEDALAEKEELVERLRGQLNALSNNSD